MLEIKNISKTFESGSQKIEAIQNVSLTIKDTQFVSLVGPSGCGKTTLLKMIAGLVAPTRGGIFLHHKKITEAGARLGLVPQNFSLFPWLTVQENITFSLKIKKVDVGARQKIIAHYVHITGLREVANLYPKNLSGGMAQRVAIARTLANNPEILLLDEPFGALDVQTRTKLQNFFVPLWEQERKTIVLVTHDIAEAIYLSDVVYVMTKRPMRLKRYFVIPFPRPRLPELRLKKEFFDLTNEIMREI